MRLLIIHGMILCKHCNWGQDCCKQKGVNLANVVPVGDAWVSMLAMARTGEVRCVCIANQDTRASGAYAYVFLFTLTLDFTFVMCPGRFRKYVLLTQAHHVSHPFQNFQSKTWFQWDFENELNKHKSQETLLWWRVALGAFNSTKMSCVCMWMYPSRGLGLKEADSTYQENTSLWHLSSMRPVRKACYFATVTPSTVLPGYV